MALLDIPKGIAGTRTVLRKMTELTNKGTTNQSTIEFTNDLVKDLPERNQYAEAEKIFEFVRDEIRYIKDPHKVEMVYSAEKTLNPTKQNDEEWKLSGRMQGDCDDKCVALATMLQTIGIPTRFVAVKTITKPKTFSHVYTEANVNNKWIAMESILQKPMGWSYKFPLEKLYADNSTGKLKKKAGLLSGLGEPFVAIEGLGYLLSNVEAIEHYGGSRFSDAKSNIIGSLKNPLMMVAVLIIGFALLPKIIKK